MSDDGSFVDRCLQGDALLDEIDDFVEEWHSQGGLGRNLHDYLGLTWEEYQLWVERPSSLRLIVAARNEGRSVQDLLSSSAGMKIAARAASSDEAREIAEWLRQTGRLD